MRRSLIAMAALVSSLALAACGGSTSQPLPAGLQGKSAAWVLLTSRTAGVKAGFALISAQSVPHSIGSAVIQAGTVTGSESSSGAGGKLEVRLVNNVVYFQGDSRYMHVNFPKAHTDYSGKWISIPYTSPLFSSGTNLTVAGNFVNVMPTANLRVAGVRTYNGTKCVLVTGQYSDKSGGSIKVYINYASPFLPVAVVSSVSLLGHGAGQIESYSKWGVPFVVTAPSSSTPITAAGLK